MGFELGFPIIFLALVSGITTVIGVWLAYVFQKSSSVIVAGIGFSTGIMVMISLFDLVPNASNDLGALRTLSTAALGVLFSFTINKIIPHLHLVKEHIRESGPNKTTRITLTTAYLIAFGLILHDVPEGFAMANSFLYSISLGLLVAAAIALHNIPEEFAMALPMIASGKKKSFIVKLAIVSGMAEPIGATLGLFAANIVSGLNPWLLSFTAGIMVFVALHELWPMARRYQRPRPLLLGALCSVAIFMILSMMFPGL